MLTHSIKCDLHARHFYSNTNQSDESWPVEPLARQLVCANLSEQDFVFINFDEILPLSNSKEPVLQRIEQLHLNSTNHNLNLAQEK